MAAACLITSFYNVRSIRNIYLEDDLESPLKEKDPTAICLFAVNAISRNILFFYFSEECEKIDEWKTYVFEIFDGFKKEEELDQVRLTKDKMLEIINDVWGSKKIVFSNEGVNYSINRPNEK